MHLARFWGLPHNHKQRAALPWSSGFQALVVRTAYGERVQGFSQQFFFFLAAMYSPQVVMLVGEIGRHY